MKKILSPFVLLYLRFFAKLQLKKINPLIIGIGGATGKSSVSSLIFLVLGSKFSIKQSKGKNSETGIPLNILDIELPGYGYLDWFRVFILAPLRLLTNFKKYDVYVAEMGIDSPLPPKNMDYLLRIIQPNIGILTNINLEHSVYFDPLVKEDDDQKRKEEILKITGEQEGLLLKAIGEGGRTIVNLDDPNISSLLPLRSKVTSISAKDVSADFYISKIYYSENSFKVEFIFLKENYEITIQSLLPKYFAYSFVFAIATAFCCEISVKEAIGILSQKFSLPPGRFSVFKGTKNTTIFDSSYNSSLEAAVGALYVLKEVGGNRRKVGILGDMRELGSLGQIQHRILAKEILKTLDFAILIGPLMNEIVAPILGREKFNFIALDNYKNAKDKIPGLIKKNDLVLVKGSQNTLFLERAVELLLEDKNDRDRLCRRGSFWDRKRKEAVS